jgi:hypothetical protein
MGLIPHHSLIRGVGYGIGSGIIEIFSIGRFRSSFIDVAINMEFFVVLRETGLTVLTTAAFVKRDFSFPA